MKRLLAVLLISLFCLVLVAGCGKKQEQTETPATEQAPATGDTAAAPTDTTQAQPGGGK